MQDQEMLLNETLEHWKDIHMRIRNDLSAYERNMQNTLSYYNNQDRVSNKEVQTVAPVKEVPKEEHLGENSLSPINDSFTATGDPKKDRNEIGLRGKAPDRLKYKQPTNTIFVKGKYINNNELKYKLPLKHVFLKDFCFFKYLYEIIHKYIPVYEKIQ
jgi:hypothetical protein